MVVQLNPSPLPAWTRNQVPFAEVIRQLREYFAGERAEFKTPLTMNGNVLERRVWGALQDIPYGVPASHITFPASRSHTAHHWRGGQDLPAKQDASHDVARDDS